MAQAPCPRYSTEKTFLWEAVKALQQPGLPVMLSTNETHELLWAHQHPKSRMPHTICYRWSWAQGAGKLQLPLCHDIVGIYAHVGQSRVKNGKPWSKVPSWSQGSSLEIKGHATWVGRVLAWWSCEACPAPSACNSQGFGGRNEGYKSLFPAC